MKAKKLTALLLSVAMITTLSVGCGSTDKPAAEATTEKKAETKKETKKETKEEAKTDKTAGNTDWANFTIDPTKIPKEKLDTTLSVACSIRGLSNPYLITIGEGMDMFCEYLDSIGQKYNKQILDSGGNNDVEIDNMKQFAAAANGNAIAYSDPNEASICTALVEAMAESGGYIGTAWNKTDDMLLEDYNPNWVCHTSPDDKVSGGLIMNALAEAMGDKGEILVLDGALGNTAGINRGIGLDAELKKHPNIKVAARDTGNWDTAEALTLIETWLNQYPEVKGIWCANDNMATGALQALDSAGLKGKVKVVGIDANTDIVEAIKAGDATATISSNGYLQGGYTLAIAYAAWTGLIDPSEVPEAYRQFATPAKLVDSKTVDAYIKEFVDSKPKLDLAKIYSCKAD